MNYEPTPCGSGLIYDTINTEYATNAIPPIINNITNERIMMINVFIILFIETDKMTIIFFLKGGRGSFMFFAFWRLIAIAHSLTGWGTLL